MKMFYAPREDAFEFFYDIETGGVGIYYLTYVYNLNVYAIAQWVIFAASNGYILHKGYAYINGTVFSFYKPEIK